MSMLAITSINERKKVESERCFPVVRTGISSPSLFRPPPRGEERQQNYGLIRSRMRRSTADFPEENLGGRFSLSSITIFQGWTRFEIIDVRFPPPNSLPGSAPPGRLDVILPAVSNWNSCGQVNFRADCSLLGRLCLLSTGILFWRIEGTGRGGEEKGVDLFPLQWELLLLYFTLL